MSVLVEFSGVSAYATDGRSLFDGLDMTLNGGEKVLLTAPLASGKSLIIKWMTGLALPDKGAVSVFGKPLAGLSDHALNRIRSRIGVVAHESVLISNLKVVENCALPLQYHLDMPYDDAIDKAMGLLKKAGFTGNPWDMPGNLPMYARKQAVCARALANDPEIVICEALSDGLTPIEREHLFAMLLDYHKAGKGRLCFFTGNDASDEPVIKPDRMLRIERGVIITGC
ncbi:MAG: ATP-binding cassette domain-containing protein [Deltaproteobacteria bacterium]|nr:ATP-binding cassette domain-containing protein [Deltaproteobacteria bacterium]